MTRLTEEMVIARSKQSDLGSIKKLNCWGSDLSDVSIVKRMRGVEVLALSVNKINTLQPFEDCTKLQELYLRKNNIQDINEIAYLQSLPLLKYLWLEENPCCDKAGSKYRTIVLRALPNLKKLDNIEVTQEEIDEALRDNGGRDSVSHEQEAYEDAYDVKQQQQQQQHYEAQQQHHHHQQRQQQQLQQQQQHYQSPSQSQSQMSQQYYAQQRNSSSPQKEEQTDPSSPRYNNNSNHTDRTPCHQFDEYYQSDRPAYPVNYRHSQSDLTEWDEHPQPHNHYGSISALHHGSRRTVERDDHRYSARNANVRENGDWDDSERPKARSRFGESASTVSSAVLNHYTGYHRRPINRNSNLLSATLCLVKELDYPSLEVVEHAVRCRIDELAAE